MGVYPLILFMVWQCADHVLLFIYLQLQYRICDILESTHTFDASQASNSAEDIQASHTALSRLFPTREVPGVLLETSMEEWPPTVAMPRADLGPFTNLTLQSAQPDIRDSKPKYIL